MRIKNETYCTCGVCKEGYPVNEVVRHNGDVWWKFVFCSKKCYNKQEEFIVELMK